MIAATKIAQLDVHGWYVHPCPGTLRGTELICRVMPTTVVRALPAGSPPPSLAGPLLDQGRRAAHLHLQAFLFSPGHGFRNHSKLKHLFFLFSPSSRASSDLSPSSRPLPPSSQSILHGSPHFGLRPLVVVLVVFPPLGCEVQHHILLIAVWWRRPQSAGIGLNVGAT